MAHKLSATFKTGILITFSMVLMSAFLLPAVVLADAKDDVLQGVGNPPAGSPSSPESVIETVIDLLSAVVAAIAVIMIIIGGFKYVTSGGDSNGTKSAQNTILYAIVGLVVVALAQVIVKFVIERV